MTEFVKATIVEDDYERGFADGQRIRQETISDYLAYAADLEERIVNLELRKDALHVKVWNLLNRIMQGFNHG